MGLIREMITKQPLQETEQGNNGYEYIEKLDNGLVMVMKDNLYGLNAADGKELVPCIYNAMRYFHEGLASVRLGHQAKGHYGYINEKGELVINCDYTNAGNFHDGLAQAEIGNRRGLIKANGEALASFRFYTPSELDDIDRLRIYNLTSEIACLDALKVLKFRTEKALSATTNPDEIESITASSKKKSDEIINQKNKIKAVEKVLASIDKFFQT